MEENENIQSENSDNLISLLGNSTAINNKYSLFIIWTLFLGVLIFSFFVIHLQFNWKEIDTWLLELFLTTLGILFVISYLAFEAKIQKSPRKFLKNFYKFYTNEDDKVKIIKEWKFSEFKAIVKYEKVIIWINLEYDNFYFKSYEKEIIDKLVEKWAKRINSTNAWLWKNCPDSYEKRILQLQEYIDFVKNNLN